MSSPRVPDISILDAQVDAFNFLEKRMSYDGGGSLEYVGYNKTPNASVDASTWFIVKLSYTGTSVVRYQLPDGGTKFGYDWTNRATFFS